MRLSNSAGNPGQFLGLDIGSVRTGVAVADASGVLASPLGVVRTEPRDSLGRRISELVGDREICTLVVGLPLDQYSEEGESAAMVREIADSLAAGLGLEIHYVDERFSTSINQPRYKSGKRTGRSKVENIDALAAATILQGFLDYR